MFLTLSLFYYFYAQRKSTMEQLKKSHKKLAEATAQLKRAIDAGYLLNIDRDIILNKIAKAYDIVQNYSTDGARPVQMGKPSPQAQTQMHDAMNNDVEKQQAIAHPTSSESEHSEKVQPITEEKVDPGTKEGQLKTSITPTENAVPRPIDEPVLDKTAVGTKTDTKVQQANPTGTISDKYKLSPKLVNEQVGVHTNRVDVATKLQNRPINNLSRAIGINDKFLFTKELFNGNADTYAATIKTLNGFNDLNEAIIYLQEHFNWDSENESAARFIDIIRRKFL